jgi:hypothetical protein
MATPPPDDPNPKARLAPTRPSTLAVAALATLALTWIAIGNYWYEMPTLPWFPPLTLIGLAVFEAVEALTTRNRIERKSGAGPLRPLVIARYAVLAKASALAGALFGGMYVGASAWLIEQRGTLSRIGDDLPQALLGAGGSVLLVAAALWLERSCRIPPSSRDEDRFRADADREEDDQPA